MFKRVKKLIEKITQKFNVLKVLKLFARCWNGEASLSQAFWIVYVLFGVIQLILLECFFNHYISGSWISLHTNNLLTDKLITLAFPYLFFSTMCVWSCGKNSWLEWNVSSKIIVSLPLMVASFHLTNVL